MSALLRLFSSIFANPIKIIISQGEYGTGNSGAALPEIIIFIRREANREKIALKGAPIYHIDFLEFSTGLSRFWADFANLTFPRFYFPFS